MKLPSFKNKNEEQEIEISNDGDYKVKENKSLNIIIKVVALIAAIVIWIYAVGSDSPYHERTFYDVTISVENIPSGMSIISGGGSVTDVTVRGRRSDVQALTVEDIKLYVDASTATESSTYQLDVKSTLPNGITLQSLTKSSVSVHIGISAEKSLKVSVILKGYSIPPNCTLETSVTNISAITVKGPEDELEKIASAQVVIEPGNITSSLKSSGTIKLFDENGNEYSNPFITQSASEALVNIDLITTKELTLTVNYKHGLFNHKNADITITPSKINVSGKYDILSNMNELSIYTIDEKQIYGDSKINISPSLPEGLSFVGENPDVEISIEHVNTTVKTITIPDFAFTIEGKESGYSYNIDQDLQIKIRVSKNSNYIYLNYERISATVDVSGYTVGSSLVPVELIIKDIGTGSDAYILGEYTIPITVSESTEVNG